MTATYDGSTIDTDDVDWVRFTINDTDTSNAKLEDEEISALVTVEGNKWLAAAAALERLMIRWSSAGDGTLMKQVDDLRIEYGQGREGAMEALQARIAYLRAKGNRERATAPAVFRVVGNQAEGF